MRSAIPACLGLLGLLLSTIPPQACAQPAGRFEHYEVYDADLLPSVEYDTRRAALRSRMSEHSAMLVRSAEEKVRSNDVEYEFRQRSNMIYLTGVLEPESAILLVPRGVRVNDSLVHEVLFLAARNPKYEAFEGLRLGPTVGATVTGVRATLPFSRLSEFVATVLPSIDTLYYDGWLHKSAHEPLTGTTYFWETEHLASLRERSPSLVVRDAAALLTPMRMIKTEAELALMQRAVDISLEGHRAAMRHAEPGMHEYEIEAMMEYTFRILGAEDAAYPSIVGSGPNTTILHYSTSRRRTKPGDLVLMDCGAEYHGYAADITRTFPVDGRFTDEQRAIYDLVLTAQNAAIDACRAGNNFRRPHVVAMGVIAEGLEKLGIIDDAKDAPKYFNHGTSHYLGLDVHDVGDHGELRPGVVLTVEPGIYVPEGSPCDSRWWNIGVRIEDDILVTYGAPHNMSAALVRAPSDIEALMREPVIVDIRRGER